MTERISLHDTIQAGDIIAAADMLHDRRHETQSLRDMLLVTLARCMPQMPPEQILEIAARHVADMRTAA